MASVTTVRNMTSSPEGLLEDVHCKLLCSSDSHKSNHYGTFSCQGSYSYYHYCCDGVDDRGWGCGYRTLQTICSWLLKCGCKSVKGDVPGVPRIRQIQEALVTMDDKPKSFCGSKQWIGSFEVCLVLDFYYEVSCKIIHLNRGQEIVDHMEELAKHFREVGSPIMMGGETDNSSKGIMGVCLERQALLIVDPHCPDRVRNTRELQDRGFIKWLPVSLLHETFYNLCLPLPTLSRR